MVYDTIIIGSGPAGLTASIYSARAGLKTLVMAGERWGGQLMLTSEVENFPGFVDGILGPELMGNMRKQAERLGVLIIDKNVTEVDFKSKPFAVFGDLGGIGEKENNDSGQAIPAGRQARVTEKRDGVYGRAVIVATGAETLWLNVPGEQKLIGRGVSSCAPCDAFFFKGKKVVVVGGGDSAMEEASYLSKFASEVTIIHRRDKFRASKIMQERVLALPNVKILMNTVVEEVLGENKVEGVKIKELGGEGKDGVPRNLEIDGVFVAVGHKPSTEIFSGKLEVDEKGFIKRREVFDTETGLIKYKMATSVEGVFVAGDVTDYNYKQAITAAGYGCMAAMEVERWLTENNSNNE